MLMWHTWFNTAKFEQKKILLTIQNLPAVEPNRGPHLTKPDNELNEYQWPGRLHKGKGKEKII